MWGSRISILEVRTAVWADFIIRKNDSVAVGAEQVLFLSFFE
jgi:hypothetical protein